MPPIIPATGANGAPTSGNSDFLMPDTDPVPCTDPVDLYLGALMWSATAADARADLGLVGADDLPERARIVHLIATEVQVAGQVPTPDAISLRAYATGIVGRGQRHQDIVDYMVDCYRGYPLRPAGAAVYARAIHEGMLWDRLAEMSRRVAQLADEGDPESVRPVLDGEYRAIGKLLRRINTGADSRGEAA